MASAQTQLLRWSAISYPLLPQEASGQVACGCQREKARWGGRRGRKEGRAAAEGKPCHLVHVHVCHDKTADARACECTIARASTRANRCHHSAGPPSVTACWEHGSVCAIFVRPHLLPLSPVSPHAGAGIGVRCSLCQISPSLSRSPPSLSR